MSIAENLANVHARIAAACSRAGRANDVTLVAVTKVFPADYVTQAIAAGATDIGENRVQEARDKKPDVAGSARWHLIGHLQSNKAKDAVKLFDVIQTVDSIDLGQKIARAAEAVGKRQEVLLQVNVGGEAQKSGADARDVDAIARALRTLDALDLRGLMTIPPIGEAEATRRYFRELKAMRDALGLEHLSMGMSEDFETAIEEGATIVRVGRAIFGSRA